ncbi:MAG: hypothetical protein AABW50_01060 [Nanoarchaeota archaeon]
MFELAGNFENNDVKEAVLEPGEILIYDKETGFGLGFKYCAILQDKECYSQWLPMELDSSSFLSQLYGLKKELKKEVVKIGLDSVDAIRYCQEMNNGVAWGI